MEKNYPDNQRLYKMVKKFLKKKLKKVAKKFGGLEKSPYLCTRFRKGNTTKAKTKKLKLIEILKNKYKQSTKKRVALISLKSMRLK